MTNTLSPLLPPSTVVNGAFDTKGVESMQAWVTQRFRDFRGLKKQPLEQDDEEEVFAHAVAAAHRISSISTQAKGKLGDFISPELLIEFKQRGCKRPKNEDVSLLDLLWRRTPPHLDVSRAVSTNPADHNAMTAMRMVVSEYNESVSRALLTSRELRYGISIYSDDELLYYEVPLVVVDETTLTANWRTTPQGNGVLDIFDEDGVHIMGYCTSGNRTKYRVPLPASIDDVHLFKAETVPLRAYHPVGPTIDPKELDGLTPEEQVAASLLSIPNFVEIASDSLLRSVNTILQDKTMDEVCSSVKAAIGSVLEQYILPSLGLPKNDKGIDTAIAGHGVDIKHSVARGWMVGEEGFGHLCLLFQTNYKKQQFSVGIVRATLDNLHKGKNKDSKKGFRASGQKKIKWLIRNEPFRPLPDISPQKEIATLRSQITALMAEISHLKIQNTILEEENNHLAFLLVSDC